MRQFVLGFSIFSMLFLFAGEASAQKIIDKNQINERIRALRSRLKEYQTIVQKAPETVELKLEQISEELENRDDVAVTVLFHDPENNAKNSNSNPNLIEKSDHELEIHSHDQSERLEELQRRKDLFNRLREKVQQATRSSRRSAKRINHLIASVQ